MTEPGTRELDRTSQPGTDVPCPLRSYQPIAMGRCVEYQRDNGCHCEHALVALRRVAQHLAHPHNNQEPERDALARVEQLDGVRAQIERAEAIEKARPVPAAPLPPKESSMAQGKRFTASDDAVRAAFTEANGSITKTMAALGTTSWATVKKRCEALGLAKPGIEVARAVNGKAVPVRGLRAPRTVADVAAKHVALAPSDDVVALLVAKLAFHVEQAAKIEKALEVLRA